MLIMAIQRLRSICIILLVVLVYASLVVSLEQGKKEKGEFLSDLGDPVTGEVGKNEVELSWFSCVLHLICLKEADKDLKFCSPDAKSSIISETNSNGWLLLKEKVQKFIKVNPQFKQVILDCHKRNNRLFDVSGKRDSTIQYGQYHQFLFPKHTLLRRRLLLSIALAPGPGMGSPFPTPRPAMAPSTELISPPEMAPSPVPSPSHGLSPRGPFFPLISSPPPPSEDTTASPSGSANQTAGGKSNKRSIVIAVSVTAAVTFVFAALFFLCCSKICRKGPGGRQNDERPLLSLSMANYSIGSSPKAFGLGNSIKEEKLSHQYYSNKNEKFGFNSDSFHASSDGISLGVTGGTDNQVVGLVPPPPGRMTTSHSLKPPRGRAEPLPPEPPASIRPPPTRASPPPPAPPPPPAVKASNSIVTQPPGPPPLPKPPGAKPGAPPPPPPPKPPGAEPGAPPAPPPKGGLAPRPPPPLPLGSKVPRPPLGSKPPSNSASGEGSSNAGGGDDAPKTKLKPFFWDKVLANPDHSMVWHQIKSGSFQFNEEMIETLFGYAPSDKNRNENKKDTSHDPAPQYVQILDPKKAQNLAILLRALNVTIEEVCDALHEGNELPAELLQTMLKMAPTADEELKLRLFAGDLSQLGPAERFLKALVDIPFAFKRMEVLLFMCTLQEEVTITKESFETLEVGCKELRNSRLFLKLLEAVLKTGNRMNDGTFRGGAQAFKLDTLLKLADVKGTDGKTTLLHFVVQEITRSEGVRAARAARQSQSSSGVSVKTEDLLEDISPDTEEHFRSLGLQVVSHLSQELGNVKKAAIIDADSLTGTVSKLVQSLVKSRDFLNKEMKSLKEDSGFHEVLKSFVQNAEVDIMYLMEEEKRIMALVKSTGDYFHGNAGKDEGLRLFVIVRDFLIILDKVCKEVRDAQKRSARTVKKEAAAASAASTPRQQPSPDLHQRLFPAIAERQMDNSSSDDEN